MWFHLVSINYLLNGAQRIFNYAKLGSITEMQGKQLPQCDNETRIERGDSSANWPGGKNLLWIQLGNFPGALTKFDKVADRDRGRAEQALKRHKIWDRC